jgi:hypothetical protein
VTSKKYSSFHCLHPGNSDIQRKRATESLGAWELSSHAVMGHTSPVPLIKTLVPSNPIQLLQTEIQADS